jgi:hypothetical protein
MLTYATEAGHALIDRELYLPESWTSDPARCKAAGVPADLEFATKPQLVRRMLERVLAAEVMFGWFTADASYGRDPGLRPARQVRHSGERSLCHTTASQRLSTCAFDEVFILVLVTTQPGDVAAVLRDSRSCLSRRCPSGQRRQPMQSVSQGRIVPREPDTGWTPSLLTCKLDV